MELVFLALLILLMAYALGSGYPVAFALPGSAIISITLAAVCGWLFAGNPDAYFAQGGPGQWLSAGVTNLRGVYWEVERDTLIAIPLFIFMGIMLQRSKIAEDLLVTMAQLFGPVPGGLGITVVFVGALLAATTGIVGATVVAMGLISLPAMLQNNYARPLATGTIAASGTLGQIIPPSIVLIILADQLASAVDQASSARKSLYKASTGEISMPSAFDVSSTSAGEMFLGAFVPGLVLVGLYMAFILIFALIRPSAAPAVHYGGAFDRAFYKKLALTLVPPLTLIFLVLGSIISGIATVNQAGSIGAAGAILMAGYRLTEGQKGCFRPAILAVVSLIGIGFVLTFFDTNIRAVSSSHDTIGITLGIVASLGLIVALCWSAWRTHKVEDTLQGVMIETAKTTSLVFIILLGAAMLTAAFRAFGGEELVRDFLNSMPGGFWSKFVIVMGVIFILGFFLDFIEIAVVVVPIVAPILLADPSANITAVWLGVMIGLNIQTSFLTPPFGFALFYLRGVTPAIVKTVEMYKGVVAFIGLQLAALVIVGVFPQLVNYLPNRVLLTSETAPPPRNPRLQYCVEEYVFEQFNTNGSGIKSAIATARELDVSYLPKKLAKNFSGSFDDAESTIALLTDAKAAESVVAGNSDDFRPMHSVVRRVERKQRKLDSEIKELNTLASRLRGEENAARKQSILEKIEGLKNEHEELATGIPGDWNDTQKTFAELRKVEDNLRAQYRRAADNGYSPVADLLGVLRAGETFTSLEPDLRAMKDFVAENEPADAIDPVGALSKQFGNVDGASDVKSALSKARRALKVKSPDKEKALAEMDKAMAAYEAQLDWRKRAASELLPGVEAYERTIRNTVGIRQQSKLNHEQALYAATCGADHRDISLNF